ncbi:phosphatidate cytidylyltransferase [Aurantimicrobium minutum]|uniref:phosphatidate cytidylyltransferase n=1 Tax=Aurantimicrobium minutum TaxID=708131 RepID=UPI0024750778|nr:phosphatidate cytidylyltransferase [Aurantimicrobium minutum]MDH6532707.1 phosphatidate cytidylyltransferase [Aurantimicrobium minutum]
MTENPDRDEHSRRNPAGELHAQFRATRADFERQLEARRLQFEKTNERIKQKSGRNLLGAIGIGVVLGGLLLLSLLVNKDLFMLFAAVLLGISSVELATALHAMGRRVPRIPSAVTAVVAVPAAYYFGILAAIAVVIVGTLVVTLWRAVEITRGYHAVAEVSLRKDFLAAGFVQLYVTLLGAFAVALVAQPEGQWWTLAFLIIVVSVDTGAYVSGLNFGKHLMAPKISPKKTWEGFAGAALASIIAAVLLSLFMLHQPWWFGLILGPIILVTATLGDLGESHIKRTIGVKDMSSWLAGHGGFLDRLDSILPSALVMYLLYILVVH